MDKSNSAALSPQRILVNALSLVAVVVASLLLWNSWFQPPPQTQLDLLQTNLSIQAARTLDDPDYQPLAQALLGNDVFELATQRYQQATADLNKQVARIQPGSSDRLASSELEEVADQAPVGTQQQTLATELDQLRLQTGLLVIYTTDQLSEAQTYWTSIQTPRLIPVSNSIQGLWDHPQRILPDTETEIRTHLEGWFEAIALQRLYSLQQRADALNALNQDQNQVAISALIRLAIVGGIPVVGIVLGLGILLGWVIWWLRTKPAMIAPQWSIPWTWVEIQGVMTGWFLGFLLLGILVPQIYIAALNISPANLTYWQQAIALLLNYGSGALMGLSLIYWAVRSYRPLPADLFRIKWLDPWPLWSLAGYLAAMPLVLIASAITQWLLSQGGGGNPLLPLILDSQGWGPRVIFFVVVSVCAPLFEETLFRGFLLPSLNRYLPLWGSLLLSSVVFAIAHLNFSDLLPLTVLGLVLGGIYSQTRNLLAPMLLHSFWNAGSLVALLILGSA